MRARSYGTLVVLLFLSLTLLGPPVAGGQVVGEQTAAELIESDFQAGTLTADQRALYGTWSMMNPALLPEPYRSAPPLPQADTTSAGLSFLAGWDELSASTRSTLSDFLTLNEYRVPLVLVSGATDWPECGETHFVDVGVVYAKAFRCKHNVFDELGTLRFEVFYNVTGLDDPDLFEIIGGIIGNSAIGYGEPVAANNADDNGVPDAIDTISASLLKSWETYLSDGYRPIETPQSVAVHANAAVLPGFGGPYVVQVRHDRQFHYLPRHELFHRFQYEYIGEADFLNLPTLNWWMEASAEWAAHRVGEAIEDDGGSPAESIDYALALADFLGRPSELIDRWDGFSAPRSYGSFILAGYLEETFGDEMLEEIWAKVSENGGKPILAMGDEFAERTSSWEAVLAGFAAANYWLVQPQLPLPYTDSDAGTVWRDRLSLDPRTDGGSERGDLGLYLARPARATWLLTEGAAVTGSTTVEGGGSFYFDLAPPAGAHGTIEVEVETDPGGVLGAQLLPFRVYPDTCQEPLTLYLYQEADNSWHGTENLTVDNDCYFATLVITNPDPGGSERTATWQATFTSTANLAFETGTLERWSAIPVAPTTVFEVRADGQPGATDPYAAHIILDPATSDSEQLSRIVQRDGHTEAVGVVAGTAGAVATVEVTDTFGTRQQAITLTGSDDWLPFFVPFFTSADEVTIRLIGTRGTAAGAVDIGFDGVYLQTSALMRSTDGPASG